MCIMEKNTEVVLKFMRSIHRTTNIFFPPVFPWKRSCFVWVFFLKKGENLVSPELVVPIKKRKKSSLYE